MKVDDTTSGVCSCLNLVQHTASVVMAKMDILPGSVMDVWSIVVSDVSASHHPLMRVLVVGLKVVRRPEVETCQI